MSKFLSGFKRFHESYFQNSTLLFENLRNGQSPKTLLIGCCDSRVDPAIVTDCDPGDLFVVRNVANLVAPYEGAHTHGYHGVSAALEYAVKALKVENIIVMGHSKCGGIDALMRGVVGNETETFDFLQPWMSIAQKAKEKTLKNFGTQSPETQQRACEQASILLSLENLLSYPWILHRLKDEVLTINGWYFDFEKGELLAFNPEINTFESLQIDDDLEDHIEQLRSRSSSSTAATNSTSPRASFGPSKEGVEPAFESLSIRKPLFKSMSRSRITQQSSENVLEIKVNEFMDPHSNSNATAKENATKERA